MVGGVLTSLVGLGAISIGQHPIWGFSLVALTGLIIAAMGPRIQVNSSRKKGPLEPWSLGVSIGVGLVGINTMTAWTVVLGFMTILCSLLIKRGQRVTPAWYLQVMLLATAAVITIVVLNRIQPGWPRADSNDAPYFESLGSSLAIWGGSVHPGMIEGDVWGYHFLAYLWSGVLGRLSGAEPYLILNVCLPFLQGFSISLLLLETEHRHTRQRVLAIIPGLLLVVVMRQTSFTSLDLANWAATGYLVFQINAALFQRSNLKHRIGFESVLGVLGSIVVLSKGTALPVVLIIALAAAVIEAQESQKAGNEKLLRFIPWHLPLVLIVTTLWYRPVADSTLSQYAEPSAINSVLRNGLNEGMWLSRDILERGPAIFIVGLLGLAGRRYLKKPVERLLLGLIASAGLFMGVFLLFIPEINARKYVAIHLMMAIATLIALLVNSSWKSIIKWDAYKVAWIVSIISLLAFSIFEIHLLGNVVLDLISVGINRWLALAVSLSMYPMMLLLPLLVFASRTSRKTPVRRSQGELLKPIVLSTLFAFVVGLAVWNSINRIDQAREAFYGSDVQTEFPFTSSFPDPETKEVGQWIRTNTPTDSIIASNSFCCKGTTWLPEAVSQINTLRTQFSESKNREQAFGGANYLLVSESRRRFLLAGPRFVVPTSSQTETIAKWLDWSVRFGSTGDKPLAEQLKLAGTNYYVIDLRALGDASPPAFEQKVVFKNARYQILEFGQ